MVCAQGFGTDFLRGVHATAVDDQRSTVRAGYDGMAATYDDRRTSDPEENEGLVALAESLPERPRLLDLGCGGAGGALQYLPDERAVGLDFSTEQLRLARQRTGAALVTGEMTSLPFAADSFDAVTAFYSVIHLPIAEHGDCYEEVARVLQPGGEFLFSMADDWAGEDDDWLDSGERMAWSFPPMAETERLLAAADLELVARYSFTSEVDDDEWPFLRCRLPE